MELQLQKLIERLVEIADIRNVSQDNPIKVHLDSPNAATQVIVIVGFYEPYNYPLPFNVTWVCADPEAVEFRKAFKRYKKEANPATPQFQHSWAELSSYMEVFEPPQYYDTGDTPVNYVTQEQLYRHVHDSENPHVTTSEQVGALSLTGGILSGNVELPELQTIATHATTKGYVDGKFDAIFNLASTTSSTILTLTNSITDITTRLMEQELRLSALESTSAVKAFSDTITDSATTWYVDHYLNSKAVSVTIYDDDGNMVIPDKIHIANLSSVVIDFESPAVGSVVIIAV